FIFHSLVDWTIVRHVPDSQGTTALNNDLRLRAAARASLMPGAAVLNFADLPDISPKIGCVCFDTCLRIGQLLGLGDKSVAPRLAGTPAQSSECPQQFPVEPGDRLRP